MDWEQLREKLTLEEKAELLSGLDFWHTKPVAAYDVPSIMMTDGPHGLRKQETTADHLGIAEAVPATSFPTAATTACSFDPALMEELGAALGRECRANGVSCILGPGLNLKRNPLCGRNFEYFSEDPLVSGRMAAGMVKGIQSQKVGAIVKHYLANNQEKGRMVSDSIVDERTLRELYLCGFEHVVKEAQPAGVMGAYNRMNGTYCCENVQMLDTILRQEWGYQGLVVTDWGAMNDRIKALAAGCDLEMPSDQGYHSRMIVEAVKNGELSEEVVNQSVKRVIELALKYAPDQTFAKQLPVIQEANHILSGKVARESAVLLKNNGILPFDKEKSILVIGAFAKEARYQGAGSSQIHPYRLNQICDELKNREIRYSYSAGYDVKHGNVTKESIQEAVALAEKAEQVLLVLGLPSIYESEGFDRRNLKLPCGMNELAQQVLTVNKKVCVLLLTGGAVLLPWRKQAAAILDMHLAGQNIGCAVADLIFGDYAPCGKLAETYPEKEYDIASAPWFGGDGKIVPYCEGLYTGYRYYDSIEKRVAYPFGYGLSYTTFDYGNLQLSSQKLIGAEGENIEVSLDVTNVGSMTGKEIVELYISAPESVVYKPIQELRAFAKIELKPGETGKVTMQLDQRAFSYWNRHTHKWAMEDGTYRIEIGASSRDLRLFGAVVVEQTKPETGPDDRKVIPGYYLNGKNALHIEVAQYEKILGAEIPNAAHGKTYTINSTLKDIQACRLGRKINQMIYQKASESFAVEGQENDSFRVMLDAMLGDLPLRALGMMSGGALTMKQVEGLVAMLNGKYLKGLRLFKGEKK